MNQEDLPLGNNFEEANSSQPTEDAGGFDSDAMLDPPIQNIGDVQDVSYDGKVKKEILEAGEGVKKPKLNYLATIIYKAYFFDHEEFESSNEQPIQISLGDISWPEGLWKGIQEMRKNEKAKIKIKRKYGFGRKENVDKLRFPVGYEEEGSEKRQRIMKKGIIYEVKLLDWVERIDIEANGNLLKTYIKKPETKEWEHPNERDEVVFSIKAYYQQDEPVFQKEDWSTTMNDEEITLVLRKILESLKRGEQSHILVKSSLIKEDEKLVTLLGSNYQEDKDLSFEAELKTLIKVEDWFKDGGKCLKRTLRKGKGASPNIDSTIKVRMRITVNDNVVVNNYPEGSDPISLENQASLSDEEKQILIQDQTLFTFTLDKFNLPSLLIKVLKSMKLNEVCEFIVDCSAHLDKLKTNFANELFDQYQTFGATHIIKFLISLVDVDKDTYFYQLPVAGKLARVQHLKDVAGQFFKVSNFKKAAKIYQKINGYYNFGDSTNNYQKEDETTEEFQTKFKELQSLKVVSFMNLVVCKFKLKEYQSIIGITDQVLEMDPNNIKCLYFRGKAYLELQEYDNSVNCLQKLVQIDPNHVDGRNELARAKKIKKQFLEDQHKKYSKFFS